MCSAFLTRDWLRSAMSREPRWTWQSLLRVIEYRFAENRVERLPELVTELIRLKVDVIVAAGTLAPLAARQATTTIPIVMTSGGDPLGSGLVASLAQPSGNVTGLSLMVSDIAGKRIELLKELLPRTSRVPFSGIPPIPTPHSSSQRHRTQRGRWELTSNRLR